jgi:hypothetical protein
MHVSGGTDSIRQRLFASHRSAMSGDYTAQIFSGTDAFHIMLTEMKFLHFVSRYGTGIFPLAEKLND